MHITKATTYEYQLSTVAHALINGHSCLSNLKFKSIYLRLPEGEEQYLKTVEKKNKSPLK